MLLNREHAPSKLNILCSLEKYRQWEAKCLGIRPIIDWDSECFDHPKWLTNHKCIC